MNEVYIVYIEDVTTSSDSCEIVEFFDAYRTVSEATEFVNSEARKRSESLDWVSSREACVLGDTARYKIRPFTLK